MSNTTSDPSSINLTIKNALAVWSGLVVFIGVPMNVVTAYIWSFDKSINRVTTRALMIILAIADIAVLLVTTLRYFLIFAFSTDIRNASNFACKIFSFLSAVFSDQAVAILCSIGVERFLLVAFPHKSNVLVTQSTVFFGLFFSFIGLIVKNSPVLFFRELDSASNKCQKIKGADENILNILHEYLDFVCFSVIPYLVMFGCNIYIFCKLLRQQKQFKNKFPDSLNIKKRSCIGATQETPRSTGRNQTQVVKLLMGLTIIHAITTIPGSIFHLMKLKEIWWRKFQDSFKLTEDHGTYIYRFTLVNIYQNNALNFIAYVIYSQSFRRAYFELLSCGLYKQPKANKNVSVVSMKQEKQLLQKPEEEVENI